MSGDGEADRHRAEITLALNLAGSKCGSKYAATLMSPEIGVACVSELADLNTEILKAAGMSLLEQSKVLKWVANGGVEKWLAAAADQSPARETFVPHGTHTFLLRVSHPSLNNYYLERLLFLHDVQNVDAPLACSFEHNS